MDQKQNDNTKALECSKTVCPGTGLGGYNDHTSVDGKAILCEHGQKYVLSDGEEPKRAMEIQGYPTVVTNIAGRYRVTQKELIINLDNQYIRNQQLQKE